MKTVKKLIIQPTNTPEVIIDETQPCEIANIAAAIAANAPQGTPTQRSGTSQSNSQSTSNEPYTAAAVAVQKILKRKKVE